ncbi:acyclic terpene utilization AtuA family protein [Actinoplanes subtropicus]|uniref:acyclic terpene utilization AtuA family protein n=1 Tax=Actinoplanes subtropicus TaxID=543632 RepID=UPI001B80BBDC
MREMLEGGDLDVLTGDYLAELTMLILSRDRKSDDALGYVPTFLAQLRDCLRLALDRRVRIVTDAGGVNPAALVAAIRQIAADQGLSPTVALVRGDELGPGDHAYLGAFGIARAMAADIVVTGRVTDASLVIGPAIARYGWDRSAYDQLAGATVAGHVLECGTQATGGNYPFFTEISDMSVLGFPIAEIASDGSSVITKHPGTGGAVTVGTVTAQLMYEIQDARYAGPDVTTRLDSISLRQDGTDRVSISGVRGEPPPPDLKVSRTRVGGYRNEMTLVLTGLDIEAKAALFRRQFEAGLTTRPAELTWSLARLDRPDAPSQQEASALLTVVGRDASRGVVDRAFSNTAVQLALGSYPGFFATTPPGPAHPYGVFTAGYVPQGDLAHEVVLDDGTVSPVSPPPVFQDLPGGPRTAPTLSWAGPSKAARSDNSAPSSKRRLPLGTIAGARSGDKGGDANIGIWVRRPDAYPWLSNLISEDTLRELLPETAGMPLHITPLPNLLAVNVVIEGLLGEGVAYHARFDPQAKGLAEWLRSRHVDIPLSLLEEPT